MTLKVNGGIITKQSLSGSLRYFKMTGPFAWAVSDGTVNLPSITSGGKIPATTYFVVGKDQPVPNSAANAALQEITKKGTVVIIGLVGQYGSITEVDFAIENTSMGWGADDPTTSAAEMQVAIRALGTITVPASVGASIDPTKTPVTASANLNTVTITETSFKLA